MLGKGTAKQLCEFRLTLAFVVYIPIHQMGLVVPTSRV